LGLRILDSILGEDACEARAHYSPVPQTARERLPQHLESIVVAKSKNWSFEMRFPEGRKKSAQGRSKELGTEKEE
jgi:hypothetical protein